jgi:hypothetical protein
MSEKIDDLGKELVLHCSSVIRSMQTHGPSNAAVTAGLERLSTHVELSIQALGDGVQLQLVDDLVLLNGARIRASGGQASFFAQLGEQLNSRRLGGLSFDRAVPVPVLREFFVLFADRVVDEAQLPRLRAAFDALAPHGVRVLDPKTLTTEAMPEAFRVATMAFALETYARTLLSFRDFVEAIRDGRSPYRNRLSVVRAVQDLIDVAGSRPDFALQLVTLHRARKGALDHPYAHLHAANTAIYAVLMGLLLGLNRTQLLDLGTSALLAGVGAAFTEETEAGRVLDDAEKERRRLALTSAMQALLGEERTDDAILLRVVVGYEHLQPYDEAHASGRGQHFFSRLVAVASAFDALTTDRPWRPARRPLDAVEILVTESGGRFDPLAIDTLSSLVRFEQAGGFAS